MHSQARDNIIDDLRNNLTTSSIATQRPFSVINHATATTAQDMPTRISSATRHTIGSDNTRVFVLLKSSDGGGFLEDDQGSDKGTKIVLIYNVVHSADHNVHVRVLLFLLLSRHK